MSMSILELPLEILNHLKIELSECGDQTSYVVPELCQLGAHGYRKLCLVALCCTPPISGYMLAKRTQESHACCKERSPIRISLCNRGDFESSYAIQKSTLSHLFSLLFLPWVGQWI